ncbi:hypothetical protein KIN20_021145 [Parelaphostrongylus tenuis]|uniref:Uncharacterized protein n=1 Tax=Parelaphostrongylus tenuis TaxID=148309 RepID=A0AAD5NAI2_PARTN|nr:hypothetical protein KIN20_021145 [Parelaphostrongylus tenuis]
MEVIVPRIILREDSLLNSSRKRVGRHQVVDRGNNRKPKVTISFSKALSDPGIRFSVCAT